MNREFRTRRAERAAQSLIFQRFCKFCFAPSSLALLLGIDHRQFTLGMNKS